MATKRQLLSISSWLGSVPSLGYALVYLFMIPFFAVIYYALPGHFYHSTLEREFSMKNDFNTIQQGLSSVIEANFRATYQPDNEFPRDPIKGWKFNSRFIDKVKIESDQVILMWYLTASGGQTPTSSTVPSGPVFLPVSFPLIIRFDLDKGAVDYGAGVESKRLAIEMTPEGAWLFPDGEAQVTIQNRLLPHTVFGEKYLRIPTRLMDQMRTYSSGVRGLGSDVRGNFVRMLYLSAVTITTLGLGDIVPLTTTSRILISVESILGVVLVGLFLNALSFEISRRDGS